MINNKIQLVVDDPWLEPYAPFIEDRFQRYKNRLAHIEKYSGTISDFANGHEYFGFHYDEKEKGWYYREWAPGAHYLFLTGDFNNWDPSSHPLKNKEAGVWEIFISDPKKDILKHESKVKVKVVGDKGVQDRIPAYIKRAVENEQHDYSGQIWSPEKAFKWTDSKFKPGSIKAPIIYEAHVGMAQEAEGVGTYREFADKTLPRIIDLGYNCIQLMAIQEHPYYGSFGYHVSNFFAPSSRFGSPEDLKYLINKAHEKGIAVIMDIVHSHAVKNTAEGLNEFDGSEHQYFHPGGKGEHPAWDSKLFDYGREEVQQFLLSNVKFWLNEYHFDGFRFDGITSMLYLHHGLGTAFDHYDKYFVDEIDHDAITYLQLAAKIAKDTKPDCLLIAEDMSGMPGICRPIEEGGIGFDFRLAMGIPDFWIKLLKEKQDEDWNIHELWDVMTNRRYGEKVVAYAESHDQALVGDKTLAFWLMDKEMYFHMAKDDQNLIIDRGIALHKMIRLFTLALGGDAYLTFIGNEFGHPEWVDFPREGNGWSHKYARRQWSLVDNPELKYEYLNNFDKAMVQNIDAEKLLQDPYARQLNMDDTNNVAIFERDGLIFIFNFSPNNAIPDYKFYAPEGDYKIVLNSDRSEFGGFDRVDDSLTYSTVEEDGTTKLSIYVTNRTAMVLKKI